MKKLLGSGLCLVIAFSLSACANGPRKIGGASGLDVVAMDALPTPTRMDYSSGMLPNYLGPSDTLIITVAGIEWLSDQEIRVDPAGEISFPLAGSVTAAGLSPRELEGVLRERLMSKGRMVNPDVSVNVKQTTSRTVTIEGQVRRPGIYPVSQRISLLQAVALSEGTDEYSKLNDVVIFRTVNNQRYAALYDLDAIRHGVYADPEIYPDDIVMIGDARGRRLFKDVLSIIPLLTTPLIIALQN